MKNRGLPKLANNRELSPFSGIGVFHKSNLSKRQGPYLALAVRLGNQAHAMSRRLPA
jgi:hypothetical protein